MAGKHMLKQAYAQAYICLVVSAVCNKTEVYEKDLNDENTV